MKKRLTALILVMLMLITVFVACAPKNNLGSSDNGDGDSVKQEEEMEKTEQEYRQITDDLKNLPMNFVYGEKYYGGIDSNVFTLESKTTEQQEKKEETEYVFRLDDVLQVRVKTAFYKEYNAYEWTVFFSNISENKNSEQLCCVNAVDMEIAGKNPHLKGILGDGLNQYKPYDYDLQKESVNFTSVNGRATHVYFPYFNLETDEGGAMLAMGWAGTWQADIACGDGGNGIHFKGTGVVGMDTYLKPGETVRTPLIAMVRYYERDEDAATNAWRKWYVDCNMPKESVDDPVVVRPHTSFFMAEDTGKPNTDGSISEDYTTWKRSLDTMYEHGLEFDFRWFDAGWYIDADGGSPVGDWWGTVGTWKIDPYKWPGDTFRESVEYAEEHGTRTLMWFEPERVTHLDGMVENYGYKREWVLSDHGNNNYYINNLGIEECYEWTLERILTTMEETGVHLYREDFNVEPGVFFEIGDGYQGAGRKGITENLYYQGHYKLWDDIIAYCAENGKCTYVDSCASGGGRNDLESMRRGVPFLRSDSDRTTMALRLAMTTSVSKWLPYTGAMAKEPLAPSWAGTMDQYVMRGSYMPAVYYGGAYSNNPEAVDWDLLRQSQSEYKIVSQYFMDDFYVLTPYHGVTVNTEWTAYEYYDAEKAEGVVQAFRPDNSDDAEYTIALRGLDPDRMYSVTDLDDVNSVAKVKGSSLMKGISLYAKDVRTAIVLLIKAID